MNERDVARLYIAEMRALLPVLQGHLSTLGASVPSAQRGVAATELSQLAMAAADLSADFHAEDCAALAATLSRSLPTAPDAPLSPALLAPAADAITYLFGRVARMDGAHRILAPSESERSTVTRLLTALAAASGQSITGILAPLRALDDPPLQGVVSPLPSPAPQTAPLPSDRPLPPPVTGWLIASDGAPGFEPGLPAPPPASFPVAPVTRDLSDTALTQPALPVSSQTELGAAAAEAAGVYTLGDQNEPVRNALSDEDLAILHAFRTGPLRRSTQPLVPDVRALEQPNAEDALIADEDISPEWHTLFVFETSQDLEELQRDLVTFEQRPDDRALLAAMSRIAHKLKGAASTLGFTVLSGLAHAFEDQLSALQSQHVPATPATMNIMLKSLAELERALASIATSQTEDPLSQERMRHVTTALLAQGGDQPAQVSYPLEDQLSPLAFPAADQPTAAATASPASSPDAAPAPRERRPSVPLSSVSLPAVRPEPSSSGAMEREASGSALPQRAPSTESLLRVDVRRMEELMHRVSALAINRAELAQARQIAVEMQADMDHAVQRLNDLSVRLADLQPFTHPAAPAAPAATAPAAPAASPSLMARLLRAERRTDHPAAPTRWDALELERYTEYDQLTRALAEAVSDVATSSTALRATIRRIEHLGQVQEGLASAIQDAVIQMRLVPLNDQVPLLRRTVRVLAAELGKSVSFTVSGEMTEIDRDVSEALAASLTQLVRNAVAHGIEMPDERVILGKPPEGNVWLHAYYTGNEVNVQIGDDGRGINPDQIVAAALLAGVIEPSVAHAISRDAALNLIFEIGISTASSVTAAAGHGIGMSEVAEALSHLRGTIEVRSAPGEGTTFHIRVPISLSIVRALHVRVGGQGYAVPFTAVLQTVAVPPILDSAPRGEPGASAGAVRRARVVVGEQEEEWPFYVLAELLGLPHTPAPTEIALVVELGRQRVVLVVDGVVGDSEMVVRTLPAHLRRHAVRGATITPTGDILLLLDLPELVSHATRLSQGTPRRSPPVLRYLPAELPRVMVVDDSATIRRALEGTLTRAGYSVQVAHDGMEALEAILNALPDLIVLDIEMPRLDGFELLSVLRTHEQFAPVRVVMLTSRAAAKHRHHAEALGADAYLVKPCPEDELLATIQRLLSRP